jgi:excisionase family DNA binding protein
VNVPAPPKLLYRPAEAADAIGISRAKLYALVAAGVIPSVRVGQSIRVPVKTLNDWIERQLDRRGKAAVNGSITANTTISMAVPPTPLTVDADNVPSTLREKLAGPSGRPGSATARSRKFGGATRAGGER